MKRWIPALLALAALGCGNYSNDDIEFLNALPHASDLASNVPQTGVAQQGLNSNDAGSSCPDTPGTTSCLYQFTLTASQGFNGSLYFLLGVIDDINAAPPTTRTPTGRTWGPFPDGNNPGYDVAVTINKTPPDDYAWAIQFQNEGAGSASSWFPFVHGDFLATGGARRGDGSLIVDGDGGVRFGLNTGTLGTAVVQGEYHTDNNPIWVSMVGTDDPGNPFQTLTYQAREYVNDQWQPDAGALVFTFPIPDGDGGELALQLHSAWEQSGRGRGDGTVQFPASLADAGWVECWNDQFVVTYLAQSWDGGIVLGDAGSCPPVQGL
jgi:hypothetical protein